MSGPCEVCGIFCSGTCRVEAPNPIPPKPRRVVTRPHAPGSEARGGRAELARHMPRAYVVPPVVAALDKIQTLVSTQVDQMRTRVEEGGSLDPSEAKSLLAMAQTLASVQSSKRQAKKDAEDETGEMTPEQLQAAMVAALDLTNPDTREKLLGLLGVGAPAEGPSDDK